MPPAAVGHRPGAVQFSWSLCTVLEYQKAPDRRRPLKSIGSPERSSATSESWCHFTLYFLLQHEHHRVHASHEHHLPLPRDERSWHLRRTHQPTSTATGTARTAPKQGPEDGDEEAQEQDPQVGRPLFFPQRLRVWTPFQPECPRFGPFGGFGPGSSLWAPEWFLRQVTEPKVLGYLRWWTSVETP